MFLDRTDELAMLEQLLNRQRGGELLLLYGRRRVGKTALLRHWASQNTLPWTYWMAQKEPAELQRRKLYAAIRGRAATMTTPAFASWSELWDDAAEFIRTDRRILVLDELPWAIETVDSATNLGDSISLKLDHFGRPAIAYQNDLPAPRHWPEGRVEPDRERILMLS